MSVHVSNATKISDQYPRVELACPDGPILRIRLDDGEPAVVIDQAGRVHLREGADVDEAARAFWWAVEQVSARSYGLRDAA